MRLTRQRRAIHEAFEQAQRPLSPNEIEAAVKAAGTTEINLATVYRNLKSMTESGQLATVEVLGQPNRYELAGLGHHHHFHCNTCDKVFDLPACPPRFLKGLAPAGFEVHDHELQLSGECAHCAKTGSERSTIEAQPDR